MTRRLLFHRDYQGYQGGHGKVRDYIRHAAAHPEWSPEVYLTPGSIDDGNPFHDVATRAREWAPESAGALFLAGRDWRAWPHDDDAIPVINLIQHVRHADPAEAAYAYLARRAIRVCVSQPVADAIQATGRVQGPVQVIDAALDLPAIPRPPMPGKEPRVVVGAHKQSVLGAALAAALTEHGVETCLLDRPLPRPTYLAALAAADVAVLLPHTTEGFYLPALEAMGLGCATVVPDCVGNRAYIEPGDNALVPPATLDALLAAVLALDDHALRRRLQSGGQTTAARFTQARERAAFHAVLDDLPALWAAA